MNWNKYQSGPTLQTRNPYLNYLTNLSFQGVKRLFVLSFQDDEDRKVTSDIFF